MKARERNDLIISWLTISLAFAWLMRSFFANFTPFPVADFATAFMVSALVVGTGFIFHELAHRQVARRFNAYAEYRAWGSGLIFALVSALFGFIFAAPGAVYIYSNNLTRKQNGLISLAGPLTNIVVAVGFFALTLVEGPGSMINTIGVFGSRINIFLALFNLIPIGPLDGSKVAAWNWAIWAAVFLPLLAAFIFV